MVEFTGSYAHDKDDNFEEYLSKMGVGFLIRKVASKAKPTMKVAIEDNIWTIITVLPIKTMTWKFKLNEETELDTPDGKIKAVFTLEGSNLTQKPVEDKNDKATIVVREFTEDGMKQTMTHLSSGTVGIRCFKRA